MTDVTVTSNGQTVTLAAPYDPTMPKKARAIGGKFDQLSRTWVFDARDEGRVRALATELYGTDGSDVDEPTVTVRMSLPRGYDQEFRLAGRRLAWRPSRDENVRLAADVVVVEGEFTSCGGSVKNPALGTTDGIVLEVRDIPRSVAEKMQSEQPVVIIESEDARVAALRAERERLTARLAEIGRELAEIDRS